MRDYLSIKTFQALGKWLTWRDGLIRHIENTAIAADALEEAGCQDEMFLAACRAEEGWTRAALAGYPNVIFFLDSISEKTYGLEYTDFQLKHNPPQDLWDKIDGVSVMPYMPVVNWLDVTIRAKTIYPDLSFIKPEGTLSGWKDLWVWYQGAAVCFPLLTMTRISCFDDELRLGQGPFCIDLQTSDAMIFSAEPAVLQQ